MRRLISYLIFGPILLLINSAIIAQRSAPGKSSYSKQLQLTSDNDNYLLQLKDGYYTNGTRISFSYLHLDRSQVASNTRRSPIKIINTFEIGQFIYNPEAYVAKTNGLIDRPFAGYLFSRIQKARIYKNDDILETGISLGTIGKSSLAAPIQKGYHSFLHLYPIEGWETQLKDEININLNAQYIKSIIKPQGKRNLLCVDALTRMNAGTAFNNLAAGASIRFGLTESNHQTTLWNSRLHRRTPDYLHTAEFFLFFQPEWNYQLYNATIQGGLFRKDKGQYVSQPATWVYQHRVGLAYAKSGLSVAASMVHRTREAQTMQNNENFGTIQLACRF